MDAFAPLAGLTASKTGVTANQRTERGTLAASPPRLRADLELSRQARPRAVSSRLRAGALRCTRLAPPAGGSRSGPPGAVLEHLMLGSCAPVDGRKHPEIVRLGHAWHDADWFRDDPCGDERRDPTFYGRSLVERLRVPVSQEVGCHSFSHAIFGDPGCSRDAADSELRACVRLARELGITLRSFALPRNSVGHLDVLRQHGFTCFRGPEPTWHRGEACRGHCGGSSIGCGHGASTACRRPGGWSTAWSTFPHR